MDNARKKSQGARAGHGLVLVDDDPLISESLAFVLREGFQVHEVAGRRDAKRLVQSMDPPPMLALVDLACPPIPIVPTRASPSSRSCWPPTRE